MWYISAWWALKLLVKTTNTFLLLTYRLIQLRDVYLCPIKEDAIGVVESPVLVIP